jgi:DNA-directed RNA polymerase subunit RPC12/RpoP
MDEVYQCTKCDWKDIYFKAIEYNFGDVRCPKCDSKIVKAIGTEVETRQDYSEDRTQHSKSWII